MQVAKLLDESGFPIENPVAVEGTVSFDVRDGNAQAWGDDGRKLVAEMVSARVLWMGAAGLRMEGMERFQGPKGTQYRAMQWQVIY